MVSISIPLTLTDSIYLRLKEVMLLLDLIFTGREFHNKIDEDVKKGFTPCHSVLL